jgi:hypothetical protein
MLLSATTGADVVNVVKVSTSDLSTPAISSGRRSGEQQPTTKRRFGSDGRCRQRSDPPTPTDGSLTCGAEEPPSARVTRARAERRDAISTEAGRSRSTIRLRRIPRPVGQGPVVAGG